MALTELHAKKVFSSHYLISDNNLITSGYTTYLKVNGKVVIDNGKLK